MADESAKTEYKAVDVTMDEQGNPVVKPIEPKVPEEETEDASEQEETEQEESEEGSEQEGADENEDSDDDENDNEEESEEDEDSEDIEDNEEEESEDDIEDVDDNVEDDADDSDNEEEVDEEEVVDYEELPEPVRAYLEFFEETGGSMNDFMQVNRDFDKIPQDDVIREYLRKQNPYLEADDIEYEFDKLFGYDSDVDSDSEIRGKKVAKKKFYGEAMKSLKEAGAKYKADLGSSAALPQQAKEALQFKKTFEAQQAAGKKATAKRVDTFVKESNKVLGKNFKGFEVKVGDETLTYKPDNVSKLKKNNLNVNNLLNRFTDKEGNVKDVKGYHKAMTFASNPEAVAKHFYDLGKAAQLEDSVKDSKNVQTKPRQTQSGKNNSKSKFKFVDVDNGGMSKNAKIKLRNY